MTDKTDPTINARQHFLFGFTVASGFHRAASPQAARERQNHIGISLLAENLPEATTPYQARHGIFRSHAR
jgi:hypothetical protein